MTSRIHSSKQCSKMIKNITTPANCRQVWAFIKHQQSLSSEFRKDQKIKKLLVKNTIKTKTVTLLSHHQMRMLRIDLWSLTLIRAMKEKP